MSKLNNNDRRAISIGKIVMPFVGGQLLRNRTLLAVSLAICVSYSGIGMIGPVLVLYTQSRGASLAIISAMASAYLIANFAFQYPGGWLADRWGRKRILVMSLIAQALLSLGYLLITNPWWFIVLRFAEGIAAATLPAARALVADAVPTENQGEAYGVFSAFFNAGFLLGPALGGILASTGYASAFIGAAVFHLAAVPIVITMIHTEGRRNPEVQTREPAKAAPWWVFFTLPLVGAYIFTFGNYLYIGFDLTLMPIWMHYHLGASVVIIGLTYTTWAIPNIILSPIGGRIADRVRHSLLILVFGLAQVPLYLVYGLINTAWPVVALFAVHGAFFALAQPAVDAHVALSSPVEARAQVQGLYSTAGLIGAFVGVGLLSTLYALNFRLPFFAMAVVFGMCVIIGGVMIRVSESRDAVFKLDKPT